MRLLAVETSTERCSVALWSRGATDVEETLAVNRHSELAVPMVRRLLARAGLAARDLDGFAFGQGPGSFTGIRIACGLVQGMAFAAGKPVVGVPTLLALAEPLAHPRVVTALDARMGEAYLAAYVREGEEWTEALAPRLVDARALPALPPGSWAAAGSGFDRHDWLASAYAPAIAARVRDALPSAAAVASIAARRLARGEGVPAERAAPLYLRDKVALTTEERRRP